jgi:Ser-tRNA(Ala) deacylase AlaX
MSMTRKVFWEDPYLTRLDTKIVAVDGPDVRVDRTIFYAFSGGQESDHGSIGGFPVLQARKEDEEIVYTLADGHTLAPGDQVGMLIDWNRRYRLMRLHFAAEVVLELVVQHLPSVVKIGAHIAPDKARIDFEWPQNISALFPMLKEQANRIVREDQPIVSAFSDEAREIRYWEIAGFSRVPCGGTHVRRTGEVGTIDLKRRNTGKGKERIEIHVAE